MNKINISLNIAGNSYLEAGEYDLNLMLKAGACAKKHGVDNIIIPTAEYREAFSSAIKNIVENVDLPVIGQIANAKKFDHIKYTLYAGASKLMMEHNSASFSSEVIDLINESSLRFGKEKLDIVVPYFGDATVVDSGDIKEVKLFGAGSISLPAYEEKYYEDVKKLIEDVDIPVSIGFDNISSSYKVEETLKSCEELLKLGVGDFYISSFTGEDEEFLKVFMQGVRELEVKYLNNVTAMSFKEFKVNSDGLIPVIVQDYKTDEVLMMAYMNEEAYNKTIETETMTYYSRSRQSLWIKGETSGHYQYVKELKLDCDKDTLLAKVKQIGVACHTGNPSCFYTNLLKKEYDGTNPLKVFQEEYDIILDRKNNPKEGSYTNYLFDKGVDKILKKVGEEATEIVIAAKNPDSEELKYEIADFLYHAMVLMVDKGVTWDEVVEAIAKRR